MEWQTGVQSDPHRVWSGACRANGILSCRSGQVVDTCREGLPTGVDAECDGIDSDCDGRVDEGFVTSPVRCGVGTCARTGERRCEGGEIVTECVPGRPNGNVIVCDGLDSIVTDEPMVCPTTESTCGRGQCRTRVRRFVSRENWSIIADPWHLLPMIQAVMR